MADITIESKFIGLCLRLSMFSAIFFISMLGFPYFALNNI